MAEPSFFQKFQNGIITGTEYTGKVLNTPVQLSEWSLHNGKNLFDKVTDYNIIDKGLNWLVNIGGLGNSFGGFLIKLALIILLLWGFCEAFKATWKSLSEIVTFDEYLSVITLSGALALILVIISYWIIPSILCIARTDDTDNTCSDPFNWGANREMISDKFSSLRNNDKSNSTQKAQDQGKAQSKVIV